MKNNILEYTIKDYNEDVQYLEGFGMTSKQAKKFICWLVRLKPSSELKEEVLTQLVYVPTLTKEELNKILEA